MNNPQTDIERLAKEHGVHPHWVEDCLRWYGYVLTGSKRHWCAEWDDLPIDDTCTMEMDCCTCILKEAGE